MRSTERALDHRGIFAPREYLVHAPNDKSLCVVKLVVHNQICRKRWESWRVNNY